MTEKSYPGDLATPLEVRFLADQYRKAAESLLSKEHSGNPLARAPYRLMAIHAIELYLNALLLHRGHTPGAVRGLHHNLAVRADLAMDSGLRLRKRTKSHLQGMADNREYLISRYGPEMTGTASQLNRLSATLDEVSRKVGALIAENAGS